MKTEYMKFLNCISTVRLTGPDRSFAIAAAVACSVADFTMVPAVKVESASSEYARSAAMQVRDHVSAFNEVAPFDVRLALDLARKFWMLRYETIHARHVHGHIDGDYFSGYFNVGRNFSTTDVECLNRLSSQIGDLEIGIRYCLGKMASNVEKANIQVASDTVASGYAPVPAIA